MLWRVHPGTVNPVPRGKHSRFDSVDLHHVMCVSSKNGQDRGPHQSMPKGNTGLQCNSGGMTSECGFEPRNARRFRSQSVHGRT